MALMRPWLIFCWFWLKANIDATRFEGLMRSAGPRLNRLLAHGHPPLWRDSRLALDRSLKRTERDIR